MLEGYAGTIAPNHLPEPPPEPRTTSAASGAAWTTFLAEAPDLARAVRGRFESHLHHVLATLRADGSPRLSGTEVTFRGDDLMLAMMPDSRKMLDLLRDPRLALHSAPVETDLVVGDARLSGLATPVDDPAVIAAILAAAEVPEGADPITEAGVFDVHLVDASLTTVHGNLLVIDLWRPGLGVRRIERT